MPAQRRRGSRRGRTRRRRCPAGRRRAPTVGDSAVVDVLPTDATLDSEASAVVDDVRAAVEPVVDGDVGITGLGATIEDYFSAVYDKFPYVLALIALITYVLLVRTFRSVLLPLKAVLLNLISLGGRLRVHRVLLAAGPRVRRDLQRVADRRHQLLAAGGDLRVPVRPVDGLRGLHPGPDARGVRPHRRHLDGGHHRDRTDRTARHVRGADPVLRLLRARHVARAPTSRCSAPRWASASSSTPPSSAPCWCPRWSAASADGTGGCPPGSPARCSSSRRRFARLTPPEALPEPDKVPAGVG